MKWYLDFGHGGKDPGALGQNKTKESETVLKIGLLIKNTLEKALEKVITTRENDTYYSLDYRSTKANKENCDYFISIHMNSSTNKTAKGCLEKVITTRENDTYYSLDYRSTKANKENCDYFISIHMNSSTNKTAKGCEVWVYDKNSKLYNLSNNLCKNISNKINTPNRGVKISKEFSVLRKTKMPVWVYDKNSKLYNLSNNLCKNISNKINTPNRGVKISKEFSVLRKTKMPALLIEIDFISNLIVENNLSSSKYIKDIADTISSTLLSFVNKSITNDGIFSNGFIVGDMSKVENNLSSSKYIKDIADTISSTLLSFVNKSITNDGIFSNGFIVGDMSKANFYRVCIGAFNDKNNAVKLKNEAISKGFKDTYITTK